MVNKYENLILTLNKFAWILCLVAGVVMIIVGASIAAIPFVGAAGAGYIVVGAIAILGAIYAKMKVVGPIAEKKFEETWMMLLICAILGLICVGWAGALFLAQVILIKIGGK